MDRAFRRDGIAVADHQPLRDIGIQPKIMRFQLGTIGRRGHQTHCHTMQPMRRARQIGRFRDIGDLHDRPDATASGHIRIGKLTVWARIKF